MSATPPSGTGRLSQTIKELQREIRRLKLQPSPGLRFSRSSSGTTILQNPATQSAGTTKTQFIVVWL